ncbi:endolytic transglycosylase MltG, partial [Couchioplanes caeruleus]
KVGLPLGPINNPGKLALQGAVKPATGEWLFFVAVDKTGKSAFAETNAQHDANIQKACQNGIPLC